MAYRFFLGGNGLCERISVEKFIRDAKIGKIYEGHNGTCSLVNWLSFGYFDEVSEEREFRLPLFI